MENKVKITIKDRVSSEIIEKKSRFIARVSPVKDESEAMNFVREIKDEYGDATHNVYAYYINGGVSARYSDDGEPQGTAGQPVLNVIKMSGITDICVVVTRYFGGTLLGAGGLVRAYSAAAKSAIDLGELVVFEPYTIVKTSVTYSEYQRLTKALVTVNASEEDIDFGADVTVNIAVKAENVEKLQTIVMDITNGREKLFVVREESRPTKYKDNSYNLTKKEKK